MKYIVGLRLKSKVSLLVYVSAVLILTLGALAPISLLHPASAKAASLPAYRYTKTFDTTHGNAYGETVATDSSGDVYVVGNWSGTVIFDGTGGTDSQSSSNNSVFLTKYNPNGSYAWTKTFDASGSGAYAYAEGIAADRNGDVYITGYWYGTVTFDGSGGSDSQTSAHYDAFLTKYNANGSYSGTKTFDTSASGSDAFGYTLSTDSIGDVYMVGYWYGNIVFDGVGGQDSQTSAIDDNFVTKYNANGTYEWTKTFDTGASGAWAYGYSVATDSSGNVYTTGTWGGTVVFDGSGGSDTRTAVYDNFLTKYNSNGTYAWTKTFDTSSSGAYAEYYWGSVATDSSGNVYVTGDWGGTVIFDGTGGTDSRTSSNQSAFLTKYNANGSYAWTRTLDANASGAYVQGYGVATDSAGGVYITGYWKGAVIFDGTGGSDSQTAANYDGYLTKYNSDGTYDWTKAADTTAGGASTYGYGLATDEGGNVYVTGPWTGTVVFDGTGGTDSQTNTGSEDDSFLTSYQAFTPNTAGPNNGDANGDGIPDYDQPYITAVNNSVSNNYAVLQSPNTCTNESLTTNSEASEGTKDSSTYSYPAGLVNFTIDCITPGYTATINLYFYGLNSSGLVLRKYSATTHTYSDVPNATISQLTIAGQKVTKVSYHITDGGPLDQDGTANGVIVDPVGLAKVVSAPNTGYVSQATTSPWVALATFSCISLSLGGMGMVTRRKTRT